MSDVISLILNDAMNYTETKIQILQYFLALLRMTQTNQQKRYPFISMFVLISGILGSVEQGAQTVAFQYDSIWYQVKNSDCTASPANRLAWIF